MLANPDFGSPWRVTARALPLALFVAACTSNPAPSGWLPRAQEVPTDPYGAWIELEVAGDPGPQVIAGELLAVGPDSLFVLLGTGAAGVPLTRVASARVAWFESGHGALTLWTVIGALSTGSHGYLLGITLPVWVLGGTLATASQSKKPIVEYDPARSDPRSLSPYARFPQGLPAGLDLGLLTSRRQRPPD